MLQQEYESIQRELSSLSEKHKKTAGPHVHSDVFEQAVLKCKSAISAYNPEKMPVRYSGTPVITLPCEPGGTVYSIEAGDDGLEVVPYTVEAFEVDKIGIFCYGEYHTVIGKLGETVFGTQYEANCRLQNMTVSQEPMRM